MVQAVSRWPLTVVTQVHAQVNPVGFVVDKVALGQVSLQVIRFSPVNIIPPSASHSLISFIPSSISSRDGQKAHKSGCSPVRRQSDPHNQNTRIRHQMLQGCKVVFLFCIRKVTNSNLGLSTDYLP
jgi:hypothetical protein